MFDNNDDNDILNNFKRKTKEYLGKFEARLAKLNDEGDRYIDTDIIKDIVNSYRDLVGLMFGTEGWLLQEFSWCCFGHKTDSTNAVPPTEGEKQSIKKTYPNVYDYVEQKKAIEKQNGEAIIKENNLLKRLETQLNRAVVLKDAQLADAWIGHLNQLDMSQASPAFTMLKDLLNGLPVKTFHFDSIDKIYQTHPDSAVFILEKLIRSLYTETRDEARGQKIYVLKDKMHAPLLLVAISKYLYKAALPDDLFDAYQDICKNVELSKENDQLFKKLNSIYLGDVAGIGKYAENIIKNKVDKPLENKRYARDPFLYEISSVYKEYPEGVRPLETINVQRLQHICRRKLPSITQEQQLELLQHNFDKMLLATMHWRNIPKEYNNLFASKVEEAKKLAAIAQLATDQGVIDSFDNDSLHRANMAIQRLYKEVEEKVSEPSNQGYKARLTSCEGKCTPDNKIMVLTDLEQLQTWEDDIVRLDWSQEQEVLLQSDGQHKLVDLCGYWFDPEESKGRDTNLVEVIKQYKQDFPNLCQAILTRYYNFCVEKKLVYACEYGKAFDDLLESQSVLKKRLHMELNFLHVLQASKECKVYVDGVSTTREIEDTKKTLYIILASQSKIAERLKQNSTAISNEVATELPQPAAPIEEEHGSTENTNKKKKKKKQQKDKSTEGRDASSATDDVFTIQQEEQGSDEKPEEKINEKAVQTNTTNDWESIAKALRAENATQKNQLKQLNGKVKKVEDDLLSTAQKYNILKDQRDFTREKDYEQHASKLALEKQISDLKKQLEGEKTSRKQAQQALASRDQVHQAIADQEQIALAQAQANFLEEKAGFEKQLDEIKQKLGKEAQKNAQLIQKNQAETQRANDAQATIQGLQAQNNERGQEIERLKQQLAAQCDSNQQVINENTQLKERLKEVQQAREVSEQKNKRTEDKNKELNQHLQQQEQYFQQYLGQQRQHFGERERRAVDGVHFQRNQQELNLRRDKDQAFEDNHALRIIVSQLEARISAMQNSLYQREGEYQHETQLLKAKAKAAEELFDDTLKRSRKLTEENKQLREQLQSQEQPDLAAAGADNGNTSEVSENHKTQRATPPSQRMDGATGRPLSPTTTPPRNIG